MYTNLGRHQWLDKDIGCVALDWDDDLSRHRPIAAYKRSNTEDVMLERPLQVDEVGGVEWSRRIQIAYLERLREVEGAANGLQRVLQGKAAVKRVSQQMMKGQH